MNLLVIPALFATFVYLNILASRLNIFDSALDVIGKLLPPFRHQ
jgi:hypothetical protein